ncbi:unnamed protein product [Fraxinus pennsylvanica]|uniref:Uncharacterized protein n=1 Tax=Fraxinus pennsylvanica TaxID=56036 RepID=A0AAD2E3U8_9LAMI|nr:unnamed protein product [Fraxinus pennsylvanica]
MPKQSEHRSSCCYRHGNSTGDDWQGREDEEKVAGSANDVFCCFGFRIFRHCFDRTGGGFAPQRHGEPLLYDATLWDFICGIWKKLKEAGFDEESIKRRDNATLVVYIAELEVEFIFLSLQRSKLTNLATM